MIFYTPDVFVIISKTHSESGPLRSTEHD